MMMRTHLVIAIFVMALFLPHISNLFIFIPIVLLATLLPDIDTGFSTLGKRKETQIVRFLVKHRGILHSLTFCILVSLVLAIFLPILALPFFLGYSIHLFADSFSIEGIRPFWPLKISSKWKIRTGGLIETNVFILFLILDLLVLFFVIKGML